MVEGLVIQSCPATPKIQKSIFSSNQVLAQQ
jgi:hypothetical protein